MGKNAGQGATRLLRTTIRVPGRIFCEKASRFATAWVISTAFWAHLDASRDGQLSDGLAGISQDITCFLSSSLCISWLRECSVYSVPLDRHKTLNICIEASPHVLIRLQLKSLSSEILCSRQ